MGGVMEAVPLASPSPYWDMLQTSCFALLPGAVQGTTGILVGHPLDTAKTRMQAVGPNAQHNPISTVFNMVRREGVVSVYRGVVPPLVMEGTKRSIQFALWDFFRACKAPVATPATADPTLQQRLQLASATTLHAVGASPFLAGSVAGGLGTIIGCPMHVIKIQTQYQTAEGTRNAWTCMQQIVHEDGFWGFYRGFKYNLLKDITFAGSYLGLFSVLRDWLRRRCDPAAAERPWQMSPNAVAFCAGAGASMVTWTILYPLDTLKTLVQSRQTAKIRMLYASPARLYRGLSASLLKAGPVSGVSMMAYDLTKRHMDVLREQHEKKEGRDRWVQARSSV